MMPIPFLLILLAALPLTLAARPLLVISVDGLDHRYLRDADRLGLKIPNLRRVMTQGEWADGVVGIMPTVTWPSHTTLITGVPPSRHGILGNRRPASEGGDYYWSATLLKAPTLWHATRKAGLKSAAITWPVTVDAEIDFNLPEAFSKRNGGGMDLETIEAKATPGLVQEIAKVFPAFPHEWMDDRSRTLAAIFLLRYKRPDLLLLHLVDLDSEQHERGPFSRDALGMLEYTDELIGQILAAAPKGYAVAIVSDHGFERCERVVNVPALLAERKLVAQVRVTPFLLYAENPVSANTIRELAIGREIPQEELAAHGHPLPEGAAAVFEPAPNTIFGSGRDAVHTQPREVGMHGYWPARAGFRSVFLLWGAGIQPRRTPEIRMTSIAARFAAILGVPAPNPN